MSEKKVIVVDGSNVAFEEQTGGGKPRMANLVRARQRLEEKGYEVIIIVDAALHHQVDDPAQLDALIEDDVVHQAPAGTDADYFVLRTAEDRDALVLSNDRYLPYREQFPWIKERRVPYMIIQGQIEIDETKLNGK